MTALSTDPATSAVPAQRAVRTAGDPVLAGAVSALAERLAGLLESAAAPVRLDPLVSGTDEASPLLALAPAFGLEPLDLDLLVVPVAAALDERFCRLYAPDAADAAWPTAGLALQAVGCTSWDPEARSRLAATAPLVRTGLLTVLDPERPLPQRRLAVPDRVVAHLLGDDDADPQLAPLLTPLVRVELPHADRLAAAIEAGSWLCWVRELPRASGFALAAGALARLGAAGLGIDLRRLPSGAGLADVLRPAVREATFAGAALVIGPVDLVRDRDAVGTLDDPPCPVLLVGTEHWKPQHAAAVPFTIDAYEATTDERREIWHRVLGALPYDVDIPADVGDFRLTPEQIVSAATSAVVHAGDAPPTAQDLAAAARSHNAGLLERLVRRVTPATSFDDLVLAEPALRDVREVIHRYRTLELVRGAWGMGGAHGSRGVTALFAGPSGTGKTLSAEVIAHELGVDLFVIDLSQVVDKYIGETEKNLERIFSEAENVNGVLFFDEADALFGKRSDVKDAHDRHANVEVAYLLQRMERFEGVAVLATNLQTHLDEAFSRRLDVVCDFRSPDVGERRRLWRLHLPASLPQADDIDVDVLAKAVDAPGGVIRNITLAAAHAAAVAGRPVTMADLVQACFANSRKRGRLLKADDFGAYAAEPSGPAG